MCKSYKSNSQRNCSEIIFEMCIFLLKDAMLAFFLQEFSFWIEGCYYFYILRLRSSKHLLTFAAIQLPSQNYFGSITFKCK